MVKNDLIEGIAATFSCNKKLAHRLTDAFFEEIALCLESGNDLNISGFGKFLLLHKNARVGRNVKTQEPKLIKERQVVIFKAGTKLRK